MIDAGAGMPELETGAGPERGARAAPEERAHPWVLAIVAGRPGATLNDAEQASARAIIVAHRTLWDAWERPARPEERPATMPAGLLYLTLDECAARYGTYPTLGEPSPILPGHVQLTDFTCSQCGRPALGFLEYGGTRVCSRDCGALARPDLERFSEAFRGRAAARMANRARVEELEAEVARLRAEGGL